MPNLLNKLREKVAESAANQTKAEIVKIPLNAIRFVCKNHFTQDNKGNKVNIKVILQFLPKEKSRTCECGIVYKRVD